MQHLTHHVLVTKKMKHVLRKKMKADIINSFWIHVRKFLHLKSQPSETAQVTKRYLRGLQLIIQGNLVIYKDLISFTHFRKRELLRLNSGIFFSNFSSTLYFPV